MTMANSGGVMVELVDISNGISDDAEVCDDWQ